MISFDGRIHLFCYNSSELIGGNMGGETQGKLSAEEMAKIVKRAKNPKIVATELTSVGGSSKEGAEVISVSPTGEEALEEFMKTQDPRATAADIDTPTFIRKGKKLSSDSKD
ncbi:hypothetical protein ACFL1M_02820 [Patescibacteria group bacterium]